MADKMFLNLVVEIEPKDDGDVVVCASDISTVEVCSYFQDVLGDWSKHERDVNWRVRSVSANGVTFG